MRVLSATEAINPAIEHTKALLRPFSLRLWLKLGLVACFAEAGGQFLSPPVGNLGSHGGAQTPGIGSVPGLTPILILIVVVFSIVTLVIGLGLLYLGSRLQLVLMDLVATRTTLVAPAWHRTASRTWRWIGIKLAGFFAALLVVGIFAAGPIIHFIRSMPSGNAKPGPGFVEAILLFIFTVFIAVLLFMLLIWILRDFVLPFILFEDAPLSVAIARTANTLRRETGSVLFYFLMKLALGLAIGIAAELGILLALLVLAIPIGSIGALLWFVLHQAGTFAVIAMYISFGLLGLVFFAALLTLFICIGGAVLIFHQAYALYFLGGRIPSLGNLLEPPPPPLPEPPPLPLAPA